MPTNIVQKPLDGTRKQLHCTKVLLIDELDYVMTKDQSVLYNLFEWPQRRKANLVLIGVANTLDLPEKFMARISSRIGNTRLVFTPYSSNEIKDIINQRVAEIDIFDTSSIAFISKRVALISSDIRKTLSICRQAVERCRELNKAAMDSSTGYFEDKYKVTVDMVSKMFDNAYSNNPLTEFVLHANTLTKVLLSELYMEIKHGQDGKSANFTNIYSR